MSDSSSTSGTAMIIGRFQPIHLGHVDLIRQMLQLARQRAIILVGVGQTLSTPKDPLDFQTRVVCIRDMLQHHNIQTPVEIYSIQDQESDQMWTQSIIQTYHPDSIISGNSWVHECFEQTDVTCVRQQFQTAICATQIRQARYDGHLKFFIHYLSPITYQIMMSQTPSLLG